MPLTNDVGFDLYVLIDQLKAAATEPAAANAIRSILEKSVSSPEDVVAGMPEFEENDVILFEDDTISIWHSRFMPGISVPPHDHQMSATIGVYRGTERNDFYENDPAGGIKRIGKAILNAGEVLSIDPNAIHSVTCVSETPCCGIHVYLGNLTEIERSLFDLDTNMQMSFNDENYEKLHRREFG